MPTLHAGLMLAFGAMAAAALAAQQPGPPQDGTPPAQPPTGAIRGRVVHAQTGEPLRRAQVRVTSTSSNAPRFPMALTDDDGRYELRGLADGQYGLTAGRGGFVDVEYGQRRPFQGGRPVELRDGQVLEHIDFALPPGAVITGRVVDEAGEPVAHASAQLVRQRYIDGVRHLVAVHGASTDDRGEFRIFGAAPGEYYLRASFNGMSLEFSEGERYVDTYYPATPDVSHAPQVTLMAGIELSGFSIALARQRTASISGTLHAAEGPLPPFAWIVAQRADGVPGDGTSHGIVAPDGSFTVQGLLPGTYAIEASSPVLRAAARTEVVVGSQDVTGVALTLSRGATVRGRIRFDTGEAPADLRPGQVLLSTARIERRSVAFSGSTDLQPHVRDDWTFELPGLFGRGLLRAGTLSDWQMKSVYLNGAEVTHEPLDFDSGDVDGLDVVLTRQHTRVTGRVVDARGATALDATVVVFAADAARWRMGAPYVMSARPNQQGMFQVDGLLPGRYLAIALEYVETGEEQDPERLEEWRAGASGFVLGDGETRVLDLTLSPF